MLKTTNTSSKTNQETANKRLDFLIKALNLSARSFSAAIGMPDSNTRNYLSKGTKLNSDYLESIASHFSHVNLSWLITGTGEPFLTNSKTPTQSQMNASAQKSAVTVAGNHPSTAPQPLTLEDCKRSLESSQREVEQLKALLAAKDALIAAKDETLTLLREERNRLN